MPDAAAPRDIMAETMVQGRKSLVPHLAEMLKRDAIAEVPPDEERRRFWERAKTPAQEAQMWQQEMQQRGLTELTPELALDIGLKISQQVYPDRWDMSTGEGRTTQADIANWAMKHTRAGPPKAMQKGEQDVTQAARGEQSYQGGTSAPEQDGQPVVSQGMGQPAGLQAPAAG
ncbi:MAG TPA: hypothetical protein VMT30_09210 [Candidatus Saccharimonadia bacterium]|nr:hypothetical protein [Candidatus Saccharimonadia bacterium]